MGKCETKAIKADLGILAHIPTYPGILTPIQASSSIFRDYSSIFTHTQNTV